MYHIINPLWEILRWGHKMNIQITADSTIDLTEELKQKYDIKTLGLTINLANKDYIDGETITSKEIFDFIKKTDTLPKTGATSVERYKKFFASIANDDTAIIHFTISGEMSACYNFAKTASKDFKNVYVVDSRYLSTGIAVLAILARRMANEGINAEDIAKYVQEKANKDKVQCSFILDNLRLLYKGGRCSAVQMFGANLLRLKINIGVHKGKMGVDHKYRGRFEKVISEYISDKLEEYPDYDDECCFITYTTASDEVLKIAKETVEKLGHFKNIYFTTAGATIASHCGENTIGILYLLK